MYAGGLTWKGQADLLREVIGNLFRPLPPKRGKRAWAETFRGWLTWGGAAVPELTQAIYEERAFDRLPILANALEEAGCQDSDILGHCRGTGPYVRGCWVVDLLLRKT